MIREWSFGIIPLRIVEKEWEVLLILPLTGSNWGFPKGKSVTGETAQVSAERELFEETGLQVERLLKEHPYIESYRFKRKNQWVEKTVAYFPAIVSGDLKLQKEEIKEAKWVKAKEASSLITFKEAREIFRQVLEYILI